MDRNSNLIFCLLIPLLFIESCVTQMPEKSPLCKVCSCSNEPVDYSVNCSGTVKDYFNVILTSSYYINDKNVTYQINKLSFNEHIINFFNGTFPKSSLKVLDMSNNAIKNISDGVFHNLQDMQELILSHNVLGRNVIRPEMFKGIRTDGQNYPLKSIQTLRLDHNEIHTLDSSTFEHIERELKHLYLHNNPLKVLDLQTTQAITSIVYLETLDMSNCYLNTLPSTFLHTNSYLSNLNLSNNEITDISSLNLGLAKSLEILDLSGNNMENITEQNGFPKVNNLKILHMCRLENLQEVSEHSLGKLEALEELHLSNNHKLRKIHTNALIRSDRNTQIPVLQKIKKIYLTNNQLAHLDLEINWDYIVDFDIRGNPWTCECENEQFLDIIVPKYIELKHTDYAEDLKCAAPEQMLGKDMLTLYGKHYEMRCLDLYGNRPERDGTILVCVLVGLLLGITLVLGCMYSYNKNWFGVLDNSPAAFSRQFYGRTKSGDDDEIF